MIRSLCAILLYTLGMVKPLHALDKNKFRCERKLPIALQLNATQTCNQKVDWGDLHSLFSINPALFTETLKRNIASNNNLGGTLIRFSQGQAKNVLRSSILGDNAFCIDELVKKHEIKTVFNLFTGDFIDQQSISDLEQKQFQKSGARNYIHILNFSDRPSAYPSKQALYERIAEIVSQIKNAKGNVLIHCLGGLHRTGIVFGVLQKCFNHVPIKTVIENYKCHVGWKSEVDKGGFYAFNEDTLADFPCEMVAK